MKVYQFDMKAYQFDMKAYQLDIKNTTIWSQLWYVRISIWYEKYQVDMFKNINSICSKIWIWYGNIRDQNWYAKKDPIDDHFWYFIFCLQHQ